MAVNNELEITVRKKALVYFNLPEFVKQITQ
jgi:hypothetical protein